MMKRGTKTETDAILQSYKANLDWVLGYMLTALTLEPQHNLFGSLGLARVNRKKKIKDRYFVKR